MTVIKINKTDNFKTVFGVNLPSTSPNKEEAQIIQPVIDQKLKELAENWRNTKNSLIERSLELRSQRLEVFMSPATSPYEVQNKLDKLQELDQQIDQENQSGIIELQTKLTEFIETKDLAKLYRFVVQEKPEDYLSE